MSLEQLLILEPVFIYESVNLFHATGFFLYPLKISENLFSGGIERQFAWNRLMKYESKQISKSNFHHICWYGTGYLL